MDGSTFVVHGDTRSFWVKLWHSSPEQTRIERVQIISCLPSTRGVQILVDEMDGYADDDFDDDEEFDEDDPDYEGEELSAGNESDKNGGSEGVIDVEDGRD
jgi:hypothetical protein